MDIFYLYRSLTKIVSETKVYLFYKPERKNICRFKCKFNIIFSKIIVFSSYFLNYRIDCPKER